MPDTNPRRTRQIVIAAIGVFLGLMLLGIIGFRVVIRRAALADKEAIHAVLERRATALEQQDLASYLSCFSPTYRSGTRTHDDLRADAARWFEQFATIEFTFRILEIELHDQYAIVENEYHMSLTDHEGEPLHLTQRELLEMRRDNTAWKITQSLSTQ
jgi:ketosteroid isomerase-like protein